MSLLKDLQQFFPIQITVLKEGMAIPFTVHIHLELNRRIIPLRRQEDTVDEGFVGKYRGKGIETLFVLNAHRRFYEDYLKGVIEQEAAVATEQANKTLEEKTEGESPFAPDPEQPPPPAEIPKDADLQRQIKDALTKLDSPTESVREEGSAAATEAVEKVLAEGESKTSLFTDLWQDAKSDELDGHAINISTYAVVFSMGMGYRDRVFLKNIALAGLIHDLGVSQIETEIVRTPQELRNSEQKIFFEEHVRYTLELLAGLDVKFAPDIVRLVGGHHEKFDGTGYPRHTKNWDVDTIAQVLSMADIFDGMIRGRYDGQKRTLTEAFSAIVVLEKSKIFPQYYNPDLFKKLVLWVQSETNKNILEQADQIVAETVGENVKSHAA